VENRKQDAALRDARAEEIVASIDYDFSRFDNQPSLFGSVLRTSLFGHWIADFLTNHPAGTVVEIRTGLNPVTNASTTAWHAGSTSTCPT
jgi:O-methyltransferase involved in polyketide biosynthesis